MGTEILTVFHVHFLCDDYMKGLKVDFDWHALCEYGYFIWNMQFIYKTCILHSTDSVMLLFVNMK